MIGDANLLGLYMPWLLLLAGVTLAASWAARRILDVIGFYRWVWHPALFDMALYVLLLYGVSRFTSPMH